MEPAEVGYRMNICRVSGGYAYGCRAK